MRYGPPDGSGNRDDGRNHEQPPQKPDDPAEYEANDYESKDERQQSSHTSIVTLLQQESRTPRVTVR